MFLWDDLPWMPQDDDTFLSCPYSVGLDSQNNRMGLMVRCAQPDDNQLRVNIARIEVAEDYSFHIAETFSMAEHTIRGSNLLKNFPILDPSIGQVGHVDRLVTEKMVHVLHAVAADYLANMEFKKAEKALGLETPHTFSTNVRKLRPV